MILDTTRHNVRTYASNNPNVLEEKKYDEIKESIDTKRREKRTLDCNGSGQRRIFESRVGLPVASGITPGTWHHIPCAQYQFVGSLKPG